MQRESWKKLNWIFSPREIFFYDCLRWKNFDLTESNGDCDFISASFFSPLYRNVFCHKMLWSLNLNYTVFPHPSVFCIKFIRRKLWEITGETKRDCWFHGFIKAEKISTENFTVANSCWCWLSLHEKNKQKPSLRWKTDFHNVVEFFSNFLRLKL